MTLFMVLAACYGVFQLGVLGWLTGRTVRIGTLMLCVAVGFYACGAIAAALQYLYTRGVSSLTGEHLFEVVRTASYTVDPFIEEFVKVAPLFVLGLHARIRRQWGLTDYLLLGAGLGAGFGLLEAVLRFSHRASTGISTVNGWLVPLGLSATYIPDSATILTSWLPAPATSDAIFISGGPETFLHLAWSAVAGLGVGVLMRGRGPLRVLGLLPILFVSAEHAALNYDLNLGSHAAFGDLVTVPLLALHKLLWLFPLIGLGIAGFFDRRDISRGRAAMPDVLLSNDRSTLLTFQFLRLPWTFVIATRFVRARRSLFYTRATGADAELHLGVRTVGSRMAEANTQDAWRSVALPAGTLRAGRLIGNWQLWLWLVLAVPSLLYFVVTDFPSTARWQTDMEQAGFWGLVLPVLLAVGLVWLAWRLIELIRTQHSPALGEIVARSRLKLLIGLGGLMIGAYSLLQIFLGTRLGAAPIRNLHLLDALAAALLIVAVVAVLALIVVAFPPGGGLLLAGIGAGSEGLAITVAGSAITLSAADLAGIAVTGVVGSTLLMQASSRGGGGYNEGGSAGPSAPQRDGFEVLESGKLETPNARLPEKVPDYWTTEELEEVAEELRTSIRVRENEMIRMGENTRAGPAHRARIEEERRFLRMVEKILSGS